MADAAAHDLMRHAWATRRAALEGSPGEQRAGLHAAREMLQEAAARCRDAGPATDHAQAIHLLANVELDLGDAPRAQELWEEAVTVLRQVDAPLQLAHKVRHLGDLHRHADRLEAAEACYAEALALYRAHDVSGSLDFANAVRRMALLRERQDNRPEALDLWREARDRYAAANLTAGVEEAEQHLAHGESEASPSSTKGERGEMNPPPNATPVDQPTELSEPSRGPICPHCDASISHLVRVDQQAFAAHPVYCCPDCHRILGVCGTSDPAPRRQP